MLVVENRLSVADGHEGEFVDLFESRTHLASQQPGFERLRLLRSPDDNDYVIQAHWRSRESFEAWRSSEAFEDAHEGIPMELFDEPNQLTVYNVVAEVETD